ncbi:DUF4097 family beta strand repeat-containing protein [Paenibacillus polygoni]|uniref:DUF4097 family beta strand repeat-containing protein n=1 Tax=Paenibacillus polygoni TaxID=3050112 RepID=A0ABY8X599_9BACL|nr:DUF4097 family beta strand repeat-containing protein [Paenibacillus polygoni]WIV19859.1 DUF4097 family beta strand repeat-containing protein [Paenibacillus polygoni]
MKKLFFALFATMLLLSACDKENTNDDSPVQNDSSVQNDTAVHPSQDSNQDNAVNPPTTSSAGRSTYTKELNAADIHSIEVSQHYIGNIFIKMEQNTDHITATLNNEEINAETAPELVLSTNSQTLIAEVRVPGDIDANSNHTGANPNHVKLNLTLIIPEKAYEHISLITQSGNITVERLNTKTMEIKTDAGNLDMKQVSTSQLNAESGAGDIFFQTDTPEAFTFLAGTGSGKLELLGEVIEQTASSEPDHTIGSGANEARLVTGAGIVRVYQ